MGNIDKPKKVKNNFWVKSGVGTLTNSKSLLMNLIEKYILAIGRVALLYFVIQTVRGRQTEGNGQN